MGGGSDAEMASGSSSSSSALRSKAKGPNARPEVSSEDMFPTLGSSQGPAAQRSVPSNTAPVIQRVVHQATVSLRLTDEQQLRLSTLLQRVQQRCRNVRIEASTTRKTGHTMFIIKGTSQASVQEAKRELTLQLAERVTLTMLIPASLRAFVIGAGGKNIRAITNDTGVRINIPPRSAEQAEAAADDGDPLLGEQIEITIEGDSFNAADAQARIQDIVAERTSRITQRLTHVEPEFFPFVHGARGARAAQLADEIGRGEVSIKVPPPPAAMREGAAIVVSGERSLVPLVVQAIDAQVDEMRRSFRTLSFNTAKLQHSFLLGETADDILERLQCSVELPPASDPSESVTIRGPPSQLPLAFSAAMERANAVTVESLDVRAMHPAADGAHVRRLVQWVGSYAPREEHVQVLLPRARALEAAGDTGRVCIDIVSEDGAAARRVAQAIEQQLRAIGPECVRVMDIDPLAHGFVIGKKAQNLKAYEARGVDVMLPPEHSGRDDVLLVCRQAKGGDAASTLDAVQAELAAAAAAAVDLRTVHLQIPHKFHRAIVGPDFTVLNAIVGDDRVHVSLGGRVPSKHVQEPLTDDSVVVRGPSDAVPRVVEKLQQIARDAEHDSIVNGHVEEMQVPGTFVPRLIGRGGQSITKLRDDLGVRLDIGQETDRSKPVPIRITGRKECVAEAKARLQAQVERMADEVTQLLDIPSAMHGALIGQGGKYVTRLQTKYDVHINFPHAGGELKPDQVSIRGGRKGVAEARAELLELLAYEQERNQSRAMSVPSRAVARILGRAGATINQIRLDSGAEVDVDASRASGATTELHLQGSDAAMDTAQKLIQAIVDDVQSEAELTVEIPPQYHRHIIGAGGQRLHELIVKAGGPEDARTHTQMVRFPRSRTDAKVLVRAPHELAHRIADVLRSEAQFLSSRRVYGVSVPVRMHNQMMARGGRRHSPWQEEHNVQLVFPKWREYDAMPDLANASDVAGADPATVIKVLGPPDAAQHVLAEIAALVEANAAAQQRSARRARAADARVDEPSS